MKIVLIKKSYIKDGETKTAYNYYLCDGNHSVAIKSAFDKDYFRLREFAEEVIDKTN